jgi:hypothetical protein
LWCCSSLATLRAHRPAADMTEEYAEAAGEEQQDLDAQLDQQQDGSDAAPSAEDLKREQAVRLAIQNTLQEPPSGVLARGLPGWSVITALHTKRMPPQELEAMKARLKAMEEEVKAKEAQVRGQICTPVALRWMNSARLAWRVHMLPAAIDLPMSTLVEDH